MWNDRVWGVKACASLLAAASFMGAPARAAQEPPVANAPAASAEPASDQPAVFDSEPAGGRSGPLAAGGVAFIVEGGGHAAWRLDLGLPVPLGSLPGLRLLVATTFDHNSVAGIKTFSLAPFFTGQYAWPIVDSPRGVLSVLAETGAGPTFAWVRIPDAPFMPAHYESDTSAGGRIAGALEFVMDNGFLVQVQPFGLVFGFEDIDDTLTVELGLRVGYQLP